MALIIILSVYNGFDDLIKSLYNSYQPDIVITPVQGKSFSLNSTEVKKLREYSKEMIFAPSIEENVFILYDGKQAIASLKGVDSNYLEFSELSKYLVEGRFETMFGDIPHAVLSRNLASELGVRVRFVSPLEIYFPNRKENFSTLNPMASLREQKFFPSGIINLENSYDKNFIYVSIEKAQELIDYSTEEVTSVNIYFKKDYELKNSSAKIRDDMQKILGTNYYVKDRFMQNDTLYKMMRSEKFAVYMILFFVIIIVSFNIFGSLSMLMIDKKEDIAVLRSMGAGDKLINNIFILQGFLISLLGAIIGVILGVLISFIQYKWGIVSMPGNFIINYYPVKIELIDILITFLGVALIGYIIANVPVRVFGKK